MGDATPLYGRFETAIHYTSRSANPFDTAIHATFTHERGHRIKVAGFYDGEKVYRVRFMPTLTGLWAYRVVTQAEVVLRGTLECAVAVVPGPLQIDPEHPYHFRHASGLPFYMLGNTAYNALVAERSAPQEFDAFLDYYAERGFNWMRFFLMQTTWETLGGSVWPWGGTPSSPDWNTLNLDVFLEAERVIDKMAARAMIASVILIHACDEPLARASTSERLSAARRLVRYAVARLGSNWNVVWSVANEWQRRSVLSYELCDEIGQFLHEIDPYQRLTACHHYGRFEFADKPWTDMASMQHRGLPQDINRNALQNRHFRKPVINEEYGYEGDNHSPPNDPANVRADHWALAMAGCYGTYGDKTKGPKVAVYLSSVLRDSIGATVPDCLAHLVRFMSRTRYDEMEPCNELLTKCNLDEVFCLAKPGVEYAVYLVRGQRFQLNLTHVRGDLDATWLNPITGETSPPTAVSIPQQLSDLGGDEEETLSSLIRVRHHVWFEPPNEAQDWVLHLARPGR